MSGCCARLDVRSRNSRCPYYKVRQPMYRITGHYPMVVSVGGPLTGSNFAWVMEGWLVDGDVQPPRDDDVAMKATTRAGSDSPAMGERGAVASRTPVPCRRRWRSLGCRPVVLDGHCPATPITDFQRQHRRNVERLALYAR